MTSCAYRMGNAARELPGGYKTVSIPLFKNKSYEPGVEVGFTNQIIDQFNRSNVAHVEGDDLSETRLIGEITKVDYQGLAVKKSGESSVPFLPSGTVLATEYRIVLELSLSLVRKLDGKVLWSNTFSGERSYAAPKVTLAEVNSANPLYNLSARRQNIEAIAVDMMAEVHDRMTENF